VLIASVLALGWLADILGQFAPRTTFANGETQQAGLYRVALSFDPTPARAGEINTITARIESSDGRLTTEVSARLILTMPTMDMAPIETTLALSAGGVYSARATLPMTGAWLVRVELTPPGSAPLYADFDVPVR
jgi:hypothetical protein